MRAKPISPLAVLAEMPLTRAAFFAAVSVISAFNVAAIMFIENFSQLAVWWLALSAPYEQAFAQTIPAVNRLVPRMYEMGLGSRVEVWTNVTTTDFALFYVAVIVMAFSTFVDLQNRRRNTPARIYRVVQESGRSIAAARMIQISFAGMMIICVEAGFPYDYPMTLYTGNISFLVMIVFYALALCFLGASYGVLALYFYPENRVVRLP